MFLVTKNNSIKQDIFINEGYTVKIFSLLKKVLKLPLRSYEVIVE